MALDFPASPSVGQKYPATVMAHVPQYTWDGEKWTTVGGAGGYMTGSAGVGVTAPGGPGVVVIQYGP